MQTTTLTSSDVIAQLKARAQQASKDFIKYPSAINWTVQLRTAFVYQQAHHFFLSLSRSPNEKQNLLSMIDSEPNGNWGDVICQCALGTPLASAMREFVSY